MKEENFNKKLEVYEAKIKNIEQYSQHEIILDFLNEYPNEWFYIWEIMGNKRLGFVSHKAQARVHELVKQKLVDTRYIGKYAVFSINNEHEVITL